MNKIISLLAIVLICVSCSSARDTQQDAADAQAKELARQLTFERAKGALSKWQFVLEADRAVVSGQRQIFVNSNTNFVLVDGDRGTVQIASNSPNPGPNNLGGITVDGTIGAKTFKTDKKGNVFVTYSISGVGISAQVSINLYADGDKATLTVCPNFSGKDLTFTGKIVPLAQSNVYKGRSI
jgi:hypothetical protein